MLLFASLLLLLLVPDLLARPQTDCEIFDSCDEPEDSSDCAIFDSCEEEPAPAPPAPECDPIFGEIEVETRSDCFDSINEIDSLDNDGRNVFNDCNADLKCSDYASEGYSCANAWNCNENNTIITDGKV